MKDIRTVLSRNRNSKGYMHGYQEYSLNKVLFRAMYKNGYAIGYTENHGIKESIFHII